MSALSNVVAILRWARGREPDFGVGEVALGLDMPKSTASRLLKDMARQGLLERDAATQRYRVGMLLLELGRQYRAGQPLVEAADAALIDLTRQTGYATGISLLDGSEIVVLRSRPGTHPLQVVTPPGTRGPAWANSTGRNLLARLSDAEIARRFTPYPALDRSNAPSSLAQLMERIARARALGYDESDDEALPGVAAVSVAMADPQSGDAMSLYIAFSGLHVNRQRRRELATLLLDVKAALVARFGDEAVVAAPRRAHG
ncbi:MAG: IclR family transcriptional regulator [Alphaproteobacteria bacterium]|nr:IclR family transcriptional regulator [Alphaproteobacteria bacterium]